MLNTHVEKPTGENAGANVREAALRLFASKGFEATGIRDIAAASGVSSAALYHYMGTKEDLLLAIMREGQLHLLDTAQAMVAEVNSPEAQLGALVQLHVWAHGVRQLAARVADTEVRSLSGEKRDEVLKLRDRYQRLWTDALEQGVATGVFSIEDTKLMTLALLEMCTGVSHWYSQEGPVSLENIARHFANWALLMVRAKRSRRPITVDMLSLPDPSLYY
jgi:AcrR family transcriptional regulator